MQSQNINHPSMRVLVVGDTGVGKSALVHMICTGQNLKSPKYTIGCNLQVMMYQSPASGSRCFIEFWDIGGSQKFEDSRKMFYKRIQGLILVYDVTNIKSRINLGRWIHEISESLSHEERVMVNPEYSARLQVLDRTYVFPFPVLVIGNKVDLVSRPQQDEEMSSPCHMELSAYDPESIHLGGGSFRGALARFLEAIVQKNLHEATSGYDTSTIFIDIRDSSTNGLFSNGISKWAHFKNE